MNDLPEVNVMLHDFIHHDRDPEHRYAQPYFIMLEITRPKT